MFHPWNSLIQAELKNTPSVVFVHDPLPHPDLPGKFYEILENASIRQAARCIVLSGVLKSHLVNRGIEQDHIDVVPLGPFVYTSSVQPGRDKNRIPTLLFFGRLQPYKGLNNLLNSYLEIRKDFSCRLIIAGDGDLSQYMGKLKHLEDVTLVNRWIGENEIGEIFTRSDLVVLPYSSASQSGVIPIAAAHGLPVIATKVGALSEQIEDGVSGWLIPSDDAQALTRAIREVLSNLQQARQRGEALKDRYEKLFGWGQAAKKLMDSLEIAVRAQGQE
jgi:glycosyltransferase involved in cell wall biosynthesis